ncbi:MAG: sugar phosphate isomerase/epimerase [bacterium]|nr:sugar phosphate isomerase/epimerase [bacterium]
MDIKERIGFQVLFDFKDPGEALDYAVEQGFSAIEFNMSSPAFFPENISEKTRRMLSISPIPVLLHAPDGLSLFNLHRKPLEGIVDRLCEVIDLADEIKARCVTIHLGSTFHISEGGQMKFMHKLFPKEYESALRYSLKRLSDYAKTKTFLCVENTSGFRYNLSHKVLKDFLSDEELYLTWDIGHTNRLKGEEREREERFMLEYAHLIKNCHIHDNSGGWDEHTVIGDGNIDFIHYLSKLEKLDTYFIIEVRPKERAVESYARLKKMLLVGKFVS